MAEMAPIFDELTFWSSRFGALLFDHLELRPDIRGLDLGCATGFPLIELAMVHGPSCQFVGIDLWREALAIARAKIEFHQLPNVKVIAADAASLPFESGAFDLVTSNLGLNNFADVSAVLAESRRVLAPGGRVVLTTNTTGTMDELYRVLEQIVARVSPEHARALSDEELRRGTRESVQDLLSAAGLRSRKIVESSFQLRFLDSAALLSHVLVRWFREDWDNAIGETARIAIYEALRAQLDATARNEGEVRMTIPTLYVEAVANE